MGPERPATYLKQRCGQTIPASNLGLWIFGGPNVRKIVLEYGMAVTFSF